MDHLIKKNKYYLIEIFCFKFNFNQIKAVLLLYLFYYSLYILFFCLIYSPSIETGKLKYLLKVGPQIRGTCLINEDNVIILSKLLAIKLLVKYTKRKNNIEYHIFLMASCFFHFVLANQLKQLHNQDNQLLSLQIVLLHKL